MKKNIPSKILILVSVVFLICFFAAFYAIAWNEPADSPPQGNVSVPLNTSSSAQAKSGGLILNTGGAEDALRLMDGNLCFGEGDDCRDTWEGSGESGGILILVNGSVCPVNYSPFLSYYAARYCSESVGFSCTTQAGWGIPGTRFDALQYSINGENNVPVQGIAAVPTCHYQRYSGVSDWGLCVANVILKTLCVIDSP